MIRKRFHRNNTSGIQGIIWDASSERWQAQIMLTYQQVNLGRFARKRDAHTMHRLAVAWFCVDSPDLSTPEARARFRAILRSIHPLVA